jgi:membrane-bound lytic murein transglycosylase D
LRRRWPDQRLDPEASARTAARYLAFLGDKFKDWRLATAAYSCGEGTVRRALDRSKVKTFEGIATRLPAETQLYVAKLEATLLEREGIRMKDLRLPASKASGK